MQPQQPFTPQYQMPPQQGMPVAASQMKKHHTSLWLGIALGVVSIALIGVLVFALSASSERDEYKNDAQKKINAAVGVAIKAEAEKKDKQFAETEKNPLKKYTGPSAFGSLDISYPKTWSAFVTQEDRGSTPIEAYFHPDFVPGLQSGTAFALRVRLTSQAYAQELKQFDGKARSGKVKISAYVPKNVSGVSGSRIEGEINTGQKSYMIMLPLRDKTLKIWTESPSFLNDFDSIILENLKFSP